MPKREDGYELWLRYPPVADPTLRAAYRAAAARLIFDAASPTLRAARSELVAALECLLEAPVTLFTSVESLDQGGALIVGTAQSAPLIAAAGLEADLAALGAEGYLLRRMPLEGEDCLIIAANSDSGILYGVFHFLRLLQTGEPLDGLNIASTPRIRRRLLNHWDNLDRTIERGYAGFSLWDWHKLPDYLDPRYTDYARACASVGINGAVLTNPNANALLLTRQYLEKAAALANVFRPYGIHVYLSARFTAPLEIGGLKTADPLDPGVIDWWRAKADEIYTLIPDFGGFLVKANSEGQPGPHDYGRTHAEGANLLAGALAPHGGVVFWRAFIYDQRNLDDRAKQAYDELTPQDGAFAPNVFVQVKYGPIDFQPREPYHPLFGAMPKTPLALELMITQEYTGLATNMFFHAAQFKEMLDADTCCQGEGSLVAHVVDGSLDGHADSAIAGVANIGTDRNWTGHPFAAASWYAFGRLAWDHRLSADAIADEWLRMTFSRDERFLAAAKKMLFLSREAVVDYMTPLGLHHLMAVSHHYGPGPWVSEADVGRADWSAVYYHRADAEGIGFDRTATGSNAVSQYCPPYRDLIADPATCPENLILWFHHLPWGHVMKSGRTLWHELCHRYSEGVAAVREMERLWESLDGAGDAARFEHVRALLRIQEKEARWWRNACLLYFQTFSGQPIPPEYEPPEHTLEYYRAITHYFVPGIPERRF